MANAEIDSPTRVHTRAEIAQRRRDREDAALARARLRVITTLQERHDLRLREVDGSLGQVDSVLAENSGVIERARTIFSSASSRK